MESKPLTSFEEWVDFLQLRFAIKIGVAATLGLFLGVGFSQVLNRPDALVSGMWTVVTAIVVVQAHLGGTYMAAWVRFLGTLVGIFVAGISTVTLGSNALSLGFSNFVTVMLCSLLRIKDSVRIASLTVTILMVLWRLKPDISPWTFGFFRLMDSCLGILVAVIVTHSLWPMNATSRVRLNIAIILKKMKNLFQEILKKDGEEKLYEKEKREIVALLRETNTFLEESRIEIRTRTSIEDWMFILEHLERAYEAILDLKLARKKYVQEFIDQGLGESTKDTIRKTNKAMDQLADMFESKKAGDRPVDLLGSLELLDLELKRIREGKMTSSFSLQEIESFFVFFFNLRLLGEELCKLDNRVHQIYAQAQ
ncbi:FUSC family protein [Criblamydia sequanensis]|uniref:Conserved putative membrane protein n=1 Tax=Candidatus Criblamydia sequanensis CRIB-18 TaxID=1437425 RepID=A0A090CZL3_9BACT|nr:FUSC family protein [Criblamydia sequanensis]CDR34381.1 Conserved putative membrane protein [Criblamydia sequanensis CRIB-18]